MDFLNESQREWIRSFLGKCIKSLTSKQSNFIMSKIPKICANIWLQTNVDFFSLHPLMEYILGNCTQKKISMDFNEIVIQSRWTNCKNEQKHRNIWVRSGESCRLFNRMYVSVLRCVFYGITWWTKIKKTLETLIRLNCAIHVEMELAQSNEQKNERTEPGLMQNIWKMKMYAK